jgi:hypothetical protein
VRADAAAATQTIAIADDGTPSLSLGFLDDLETTSTRVITLANKGSAPRQFAAQVDYVGAGSAAALSLTVTPPDGSGGRITLPPGASVSLNVTLTLHPESLDYSATEYGGAITFTELTGSGESLRVPFLGALRSALPAEIAAHATRRSSLITNAMPGG